MDILLVGVGGYGEYCMQMLTGWVLNDKNKLVGVVDPFAQKSSWYGYLMENNIPVYSLLSDFYAEHSADLALIVTPINLHREQTEYCLSKGSHVLCEKPVAGSIEEAFSMKAAAEKYQKKLGIGFQWSFSDAMNALKKDIEDGVYGKPLFFKTYISWQRDKNYYGASNWKGRKKNQKGEPINDCIITNATAHYLHNMFFITGAKTVDYKVICKKAYDIETFDTCALWGKTDKDFEYLFLVSHVGERNSNPILEYKFENGTVYFENNEADRLYAVLSDGTKIEYGEVQSNAPSSKKILYMIEAIEGKQDVRCTVDTVTPHLTLCLDIIENKPATAFSSTYEEDNFVRVKGLCDLFEDAYEKEYFPEKLENY